MKSYRVNLKTYSQGELWVHADSEEEAKKKALETYDIDPEASEIMWYDGHYGSGIVDIEANYDVYNKKDVLSFLREISDICKEAVTCADCPYSAKMFGCLIQSATGSDSEPYDWFGGEE